MKANSRSDLIDIACEVRAETDRGVAIYQGATHEYTDRRTGEIKVGEHWVWLPKQFTEINAEGVTIPEWLAKEKELI